MFWQGMEGVCRGSSHEKGIEQAERRGSCRLPANVMPLTQGKVFSVCTERKRVRKGQREGELLQEQLEVTLGYSHACQSCSHADHVARSPLLREQVPPLLRCVCVRMGLKVESHLASAAHPVPLMQRT